MSRLRDLQTPFMKVFQETAERRWKQGRESRIEKDLVQGQGAEGT